jgi:hypothetical protein
MVMLLMEAVGCRPYCCFEYPAPFRRLFGFHPSPVERCSVFWLVRTSLVRFVGERVRSQEDPKLGAA